MDFCNAQSQSIHYASALLEQPLFKSSFKLDATGNCLLGIPTNHQIKFHAAVALILQVIVPQVLLETTCPHSLTDSLLVMFTSGRELNL